MRTQKMLMCVLAYACTLAATSERLSAKMPAPQKFNIPETVEQLMLRQNIDGSVDRGNQLMRKGDYPEAIRAFQNAIKLKRDSDSAWAGLAESLVKVGKIDDALTAYRTLIRHGSWEAPIGQEAQDTSVLMRFIILDVQAGNWNEAVQVYNKAAPEVTLGSHFPKITASFDVRQWDSLRCLVHCVPAFRSLAVVLVQQNDEPLIKVGDDALPYTATLPNQPTLALPPFRIPCLNMAGQSTPFITGPMLRSRKEPLVGLP